MIVTKHMIYENANNSKTWPDRNKVKIYLSSVARFCIEYALISQTFFSLLPSVIIEVLTYGHFGSMLHVYYFG